MFGKLKEKLKNWTKSLSKKTAKEEVAEPEKKPKKVKAPKKKVEKKGKARKLVEPITKFQASDKTFQPDIEATKELIKEPQEEQEDEFPLKKDEEKKSLFQRITEKATQVKISEEIFDDYKDELEMLLLENNVALEVSEKIISEVQADIVGKPISKKKLEEEINNSLKKNIKEILIEPFDLISKVKEFKKENPEKPYIVMFCGINGSGKTTSLAKVANKLQENKLSSVMAAGDTFRAASIEQIKVHADKLKIKLIAHEYGSDPAAVGFDAIKYAEKNKLDVVLIDTAGRMHTEKNLLQEIEKVSRVCSPNLKIFVGESITGNDATEQAKTFNETLKIDAIILTKSDIDEKGGTALSVGYVTDKPIIFLGTGQEYKDLEIFSKDKFIEKLGL